jgi:hypothetical protein
VHRSFIVRLHNTPGFGKVAGIRTARHPRIALPDRAIRGGSAGLGGFLALGRHETAFVAGSHR